MNNPQELQVLSNKELEQITQELANNTQPTPKTQKQINQESKAIIEKATQDSKKQLNDAVKEVQSIYIMGAVLISLVAIIKILIIKWAKKKKPKRTK